MNILTLDAGGTNFVFSSVIDNKILAQKIKKNIESIRNANLDLMLKTIIEGFTEIKDISGRKIDAISLAFPGPADYKNGIIGDLFNIPCFRNGVALKKMLENIFRVPVFINNDGDLYAYGEALTGTLPIINNRLQKNNNPKRYFNLAGLTLGTGFGAGLVSEKRIIKGNNISTAEIWQISNRVMPAINAEEGVSIRAVKYFFSYYANIDFADSPEPKEIFEIACDKSNKNNKYALMTFEKIGHFLGDAIANIFTLFDCIIVIGGGIAGAKDFIIPGIEKELKTSFVNLTKTNVLPRLVHSVYCLNNETEFENFMKTAERKIKVPFSDEEIIYDPLVKWAYKFSDFDTSDMINLGAYHYAVENLI